MSDVLYPVSLMRQVDVTRFVRVEADQFEDGSTSTRKLWGDKYQKRKFAVKHSRMSVEEERWLRDFYTQRDGLYDSFWFRNNVHRGGNAKVRFAAPLVEPRGAAVYDEINVQLEEVAPVRAQPEIGEVIGAAGVRPVTWYDANRDIYFEHLGTIYRDTSLYDASSQAYPAVIQAGLLPIGGSILGQYQHYALDGTFWAKSAANISQLTTTQPAVTMFAIAKQTGAPAGDQYLALVGGTAAGSAVGLIHGADANVRGSVIGADSVIAAMTGSFKSFAVGFAGASNTSNLWANAVSIGTPVLARTYAAGPLSVAVRNDGAGTIATGVHLAHVMVFNALLTTAQVKALHNLFAHQYAMALVP